MSFLPLMTLILTGDLAAYAGLFAAAFLAATIFPAQSEALLLAMALSGAYVVPLLLAVASAGNILGSVINWGLGRAAVSLQHKRWFPLRPAQIEKARHHYARWGHWSLLLSWVPVIGDPLTLAAGVLREPLWRFLLVVGFAKTARYAVLLYLAGAIG